MDRYGRLDLAFNNAATLQRPGPMDQLPEAEFDQVYAVNLKAVWLAMAAEVAAIRSTAGTGAIVNNSSVGSLHANPELPAYGAMKRAVNSLTESAAANVPEMMWKHFVFQPELCGDAIVWLASEPRPWLSGRFVSCSWDMQELEQMRGELESRDELLKFRLVI